MAMALDVAAEETATSGSGTGAALAGTARGPAGL